MSALVIDTSSFISYFSQGNEHIDEALKEGRAYLSPVVAAELLSGIRSKSDQERMKDFLEDLPLCGNEIQSWFQVGLLRSKLYSKGLSVSVADAHICQCALELKAHLITEDKIFSKISKLISLKLVH
ncbi:MULTISPECIES: PIN domain-containing protein [Leptospira]|uniref:Twitching motility protein PilT n=1 Tax=Leptospira kirschneri serovar Pomona TaxID=561005 RepID=A0A1T1DMR4_9LEPT|nr:MULTISPECIES: PIN domain-containing protein [Leptospira]EMJ96468.1 PIN domain protein [Leptospira kirschneri str. JB]EMK05544.1 PIN domain protein [Leptospira kirschneri]KXZ24332.1 twitching motility protein PilT [Leptospira kirschneri]KXZ27666.1 twitching motility protein PilT [Leptospira sp. ZV016]OOV42149.1 twitching motility protein PilT [Leptospira kirschneri serovar Pomona]